MPDYEPVGVKFTTQGLNKFLSDFTKANEAILNMKAATEAVDAANKSMMDGLASVDTQVKKSVSLFDTFAEGAQEVAKQSGGVGASLAALGPEGAIAGAALTVVSNIFAKVTGAINNVITGVRNFISTLANLAGKAINTVVAGIRNFVNWLMQGRQAAKDASDGIGLFDIALGNVVGNGISAFIGGIQKIIEKLEGLASNVLQTSGRVEQMTQVAIMMGSRSGQTSSQIQQLIRDIRDKGIEAEVATNLIIDLARADIDLAQSTNLARVAQDAAVISNSNSSETLERLKYAIMTTQTEVARTAGITINADQAYKTYAETLGKTASELTSVERQQAFFNAILEEGEKIAGAYEVSLNSGYKIMQSMDRVYDDLAQTVGGPFQQAFFNVERTQYDLLRAFNMMMEEGTALNDILTGLGATIAAITEPIRLLATNIYNNVKYMSLLRAESEGVITASQLTKLNEYREYMRLLSTDMSNFNEVTAQQAQRLNELKDKFGEMTPEVGSALNQVMTWLDAFKQKAFTFAKNAFDWGFNIVMQFAEGIINAASSVLTGAMDAITNMLTYWLAPGSPPRVAPDLDTWGLKAMNTWLGGFSDADYSVLSDIGDSLRSAFDLMLGDDAGEASSALADIQKQLMEAFNIENMGGVADFESIFANIKGYAGDLSSNLITLTQQEITYGRVLEDVEKKTKAVELAEKALEAARESESDSLTKMNNVMDEYNELARSGASKEVLAAKRKEFTDAKNAYKTAKNTTTEKETELTASQKTLSTAQESLDIEKEKLDVLQKQNSQIMEILELQKRAAEAAIRAATTASGGGAGLSSLAAGGLGTANIEQLINERLEEMKSRISEMLSSKFPQLVNLWNNTIVPAFNNIRDAWDRLRKKINEVWTSIKPTLEIMGGHFKEIFTHIGELFTALSSGDTKGVEDALSKIGKHLSAMWKLHIRPFLDDTWDKLTNWVNTVVIPGAQTLGQTLAKVLSDLFNNFMNPGGQEGKGGKGTGKEGGGLFGGLAGTLDKVRNAIQTVINIWNILVMVFNTVTRAIEKVKSVWKDLNTVQDNGKTKLETIVNILTIVGIVLLGIVSIFAIAAAGVAGFTAIVGTLIAIALTPLVLLITAIGIALAPIAGILAIVGLAFTTLVGVITVGAATIAYKIGVFIGEAVEKIKTKFDEWSKKANVIITNIKEWFGELGEKISGFVEEHISPLIQRFQDWADKVGIDVKNTLSSFADWLSNTFTDALDGIKNAIQWVIDKFDLLKEALSNLSLPDWLTPGSPTPLEIALDGIATVLGGLGGLFDEAFGGLADLLDFDPSDFDFVGVVTSLADGLADAVGNADIEGAFSVLFTNILTACTTFGVSLNASFANYIAQLTTKVNLFKTNTINILTTMANNSSTNVTNAFSVMKTNVYNIFYGILEDIQGVLTTIFELLDLSKEKVVSFSEGISSSLQGIINTCYGAANALYYLLGAAQTLYDWSQKNDIGLNVDVGSGGGGKKVVGTPGGAKGATGIDFIVPSGYPQDTFPTWVSSGERVVVLTKDQQERVDSSYADARAAGMRYANQVSNTYNNESNYNLSVSTQESPGNVIQTFGVMRILAKSRN